VELARVGPYELLRPLGAGGMAETFVAVRRGPARFEQRVCLKRILPGRAADPRFVELFLDEARLLAKLRNAAIVQVYDFGETAGTYYMALELVDGMDLEALLNALRSRGKRLPTALALYVAGQILSALHYADSLVIDGEPLQLVHRDISPSNVLLSVQGEVKLTDFGIAKARGRQHKTQTGHTKGKVAYMSPEQVRGEELDSRSDLFALGVVLYEMLSNVHPFDAPTDLALLNNILAGKHRQIVELLPELPSSVAELVQRLLSVDRNARPANPGDALLMVSVFDQPFALQRQLAQLVSEVRPPPREPLRTHDSGHHDGATELWRDTGSQGSQPGMLAKGTSELNFRGPRSNLPWAVVLGTLFLGGLVAVGLWWNEHQALPPVSTQAPAAPASAQEPTTEPTPTLATPAEAARPSAELEPDGGDEEELHGTGMILHRPSGAAEPQIVEPTRVPKRVRMRTGAALERSSEPPAAARERGGSKTRSGASVSVDDF
jgi:eukaryotic-like serine/threonine-protein kinase